MSAERFTIDDLLVTRASRSVWRLPRLVSQAVTLTWRAAQREFAVTAVLQLLAGAGIALQLLVGKQVLSEVLRIREGGDLATVLPALGGFALISALVAFANLARTHQQSLLSELVGRYAITQVLDVAATVELVAFDNPAFHDRLQRAQANAAIRPVQMASGVLGLVSSVFAIGGIAIALFVIQPLFLALVLLAYAPAWVATAKASKVAYHFSIAQTERDRRRNYLAQTLSLKEAAAEIRSFGLGPFLRDRHDRLHDERIAELRTVTRRRLVLGLAGGLAASALTALALAALVWFVATGRLDLAAAGAAAGAVVLLGTRLQALAGSAGSLYESSLFLEDFTNFVSWLPAMAAAKPEAPAPARFSHLAGRDLTFTYPSREAPSLEDVSIEIRAGEVVALVGENGSGKTTLARLLAGLYTPDKGAVTWDGVDAATVDPDALRSGVAIINQDFVKYQLTFRENITVGRHERYDDVEGAAAAARQAGADGDLPKLARGYDTQLGPQFFGGSDLSEGQWQRLALARMFFRDAPFVILDEPTASLDPRAEAELFRTLRSLLGGRSVLLISHRFSSVRTADRIYVLSGGRVVEHGTHDALIAAGGLYAELFGLQAAAYLDAPV